MTLPAVTIVPSCEVVLMMRPTGPILSAMTVLSEP